MSDAQAFARADDDAAPAAEEGHGAVAGLRVIAGAWPLLLGMAMIMLGNGLQGTLLGLRATIEGFGTLTTGFMMAGYSVGFLAGSVVVPRLVRLVGHVRVFAALASLASSAMLLHAVFVAPLPWAVLRVLTGLCLAGIYVVAESWLNDRATNRTRGQLLSAYMVVALGGMGAGQLLLNVADPRGMGLFILVSVLVSVALVPTTLSASGQPRFEAPQPVAALELYRSSPLGVFGCLVTGIAYGAFFGMGAVYARAVGMNVAEVSYFVAAFLLGAILLQWPIGHVSDRFDRRLVIVGCTIAATALALTAILIGQHSHLWLLVIVAATGGSSMPLYSLCVAHTNDHLAKHRMVAASATVVLVQGIGLTLGPVLAAGAMHGFGPSGLFAVIASAHALIGGFGIYRMTRRAPVPLDAQREYPLAPPRASPVVAAIAARIAGDRRHDR